MKIYSLSVTIFAALLITISGCKKDTEDLTASYLSFLVDVTVNDEPLEFGTNYEINGTMMNFIATYFYMGGIKFTQANGNVIDLSNQYLLAGPKVGGRLSEPLAISNITRVQFFVGVDSVTNAMTENDFTLRPASDPLGMQNPSMHWSWNTGYRFLRVDGKSDTDGDGTPETPVEYHLGNNNMLKNIDITTDVTMKAGDNELYIQFDLAKFFENVDVASELVTHVGDNPELAAKLRDNLPAALSAK
ncbi:MAG: hypothetical protein KDC53_11130 [Saprospiraceae bacterium]|nr:hypothetical protein [Saprospiraceae bacterium]